MHTPGPWKADIRSGCLAVYPTREDHNCLSGARQWAIHYSNKDAEQTQGGGWTMSEEARANAHLIAAAPELLEACQEFVRKVECGEARSRRSYAQMKAVIAKVRKEDAT